MDSRQILAGAEDRISQHRTAQVELRFLDPTGGPGANLPLRLRQLRHEFKLGANAFGIRSIEDAAALEAYEERFASLLNYATLPFYWGSYEPQIDQTRRERLEAMADWCRLNDIVPKGHPLVWHEAYPAWAEGLEDGPVLERLERRVRRIVSEFVGKVSLWDVVNEATVSERFDNAVGRWVRSRGAAACVEAALRWAHEANPSATLLYNDFNVGPEFEGLVETLLERNAPLGAIGIQSHMHQRTWPLQDAWHRCETYARFGLPLHFTELTVLSGRLKALDDNDWHRVRPDWASTAEGEAAQLEYASQLYTLLFSHPAVEALTWWDFSDRASWQGAPSGLVRKDMTPKPIYDWLADSFGRRWRTEVETRTDESGRVALRGFFGRYAVSGVHRSGARLAGGFDLTRRGDRSIQVTLFPT